MYISASLTAPGVADFTPSPLLRAAALYTYDTGLMATKDGGSQLQRWSSFIGIITAIVGNILISFALNIQRYAHIRLNREREAKKEKSRILSRRNIGYGTNGSKQIGVTGTAENGNGESSSNEGRYDEVDNSNQSYLKSPYWWSGIALMTVGETGNFLAYGFAPASIVSPLGVVALISNCVIAPIMLKEHFRMRDFWGVVIAVGGAVTVVLSASQDEKKLGPHEVWGAITRTEFEVYMGITCGLIILLSWLSPRYGSKTILIDLGLVGLFGGYTALSTKGVASMLSATLWRAFATPVTYALILVLAVTAVMQVKYLNKALQRFDSTQVIPVQFVMFTISVIIGSAILYRDFESATAASAAKFIGGCLLTFSGVYLITSGRPHEEEGDEEDDLEGEEGEHLIANEQDGSGYDSGTVIRRPRPQTDTTEPYSIVDFSSKMDSRRSSHVSFGESTAGRRTPRRLYSNASTNAPSIIFTPAQAAEMAAGHDTAPSLNNPWATASESNVQPARHPGMASTNSTPVLPTEAQTSPNVSRPGTARAHTHGVPHTHPHFQHLPQPPQHDPHAVRPTTRHSISRMMPGPLVGPLSSSLSAVVAESLRRGVDNPLRSKASFTRPRTQRTKSGSTRIGESSDTVQHSEAETQSLLGGPLKQILTAEELERSAHGFEGKRSRARTLSNSVGSLLTGKRKKKEDFDSEPGPSNR